MSGNQDEIIISNEALSDSNSVSISSLSQAQGVLADLFTELRSFEASKTASKIGFDVLIHRAIYAINKETPGPKDYSNEDSILPYVDTVSGCAIERVQSLGLALEAAIDTIVADPAIKSLLDEETSS